MGDWIPKDTPAGAALFEHARAFHEALKGMTIVVDRDLGGEEDFDPAALEKEPAAGADGAF